MINWEFARIFSFPNLIAKSVQGNFFVPQTALKANDPIHKSLYIDKCFEYDFYITAINFLKKNNFLNNSNDNVLIDAGINNGVITIGAINSGDFNFAIGIDGCSNHTSWCKKNLYLNKINNVKIITSVLSDSKRSINFVKSKTNLGNHCVNDQSDDFKFIYGEDNNIANTEESNTLDEVLYPYFDRIQSNNCLLWIDVEGHEGKVFKGASQLLSKNIPCVMELCPYMIKRSGISIDEYVLVIQRYWDEFWLFRNFKLVNYPTSVFSNFINEFNFDGSYQNIILTPK